tara:strand:+ start:75 stop:1169 length:1095 start_codon:yes stop_codon:yes gene_type:complete
MKSNQFIRKIRYYSLLSFLLPLITINLCLFIFQILGNNDVYENYDWNNKKEYSTKEYFKKYVVPAENNKNLINFSFSNCPKYELVWNFITSDNKIISYADYYKLLSEYSLEHNLETFEKFKINTVVLKHEGQINDRCVRNSQFSYFFLKIFKPVEKILVKVKKEKAGSFGKIKNPYLYGEASISRTARYYPSILIFKPFIILSSILLFFYWINNLKLFREFENSNILNNFSKSFFYLGVLSCIFLVLHASFLGLNYDSKLFAQTRKIIIILFIVFEVSAQIFLAINLFKFKDEIKNHINSLVLKIKIIFVSTILFITFVVAALLIWGDLDGSMKHVLEWNYFSVLLIFYFLSFLLWKPLKNQKF